MIQFLNYLVYTHHFKVVNGQVAYFKGLDDLQTGTPQEMNKPAALKIMEKLHKRNLDAVVSSFASDTRFHGWAPQALDVNGYKQAMSDIFNAPTCRCVPLLWDKRQSGINCVPPLLSGRGGGFFPEAPTPVQGTRDAQIHRAGHNFLPVSGY